MQCSVISQWRILCTEQMSCALFSEWVKDVYKWTNCSKINECKQTFFLVTVFLYHHNIISSTHRLDCFLYTARMPLPLCYLNTYQIFLNVTDGSKTRFWDLNRSACHANRKNSHPNPDFRFGYNFGKRNTRIAKFINYIKSAVNHVITRNFHAFLHETHHIFD